MAAKKSRGKPRRKSSRSKKSAAFNNDVLIVYKGPVMIPDSFEQKHVISENFSYFFPLNATVGGSVDNVYGSGSVTNANDWSSIAACFHEYRVLAFKMHFVPLVSYTTNYPTFVAVVDRQNNGTLGTYVAAANHESVQVWPSRYPKQITARMDGIEEAQWNQTSASTDRYYIKHFGTNFTASQNVGNILFTYLVQFRGRA